MINNFHIHLYYNESNINLAKDLAKKVEEKYSIKVGKFHKRNVGPHPMWSVQLSIPTDMFGDILSFVAINRNGLIVFSHPDTGNVLLDHTEYAIWMGDVLDLNLDMLI